MSVGELKILLILTYTGSALCACAGARRASSAAPACTGFFQVTRNAPRLAAVVPRVPPDGAFLIGYVADSLTQHAIVNASIVVRPVGRPGRDTSTYSDSTGGFVLELPARGVYQFSVRSINYAMVRDSIRLMTQAETVRVSMRRSVPLCAGFE